MLSRSDYHRPLSCTSTRIRTHYRTMAPLPRLLLAAILHRCHQHKQGTPLMAHQMWPQSPLVLMGQTRPMIGITNLSQCSLHLSKEERSHLMRTIIRMDRSMDGSSSSSSLNRINLLRSLKIRQLNLRISSECSILPP